MKIHSENSIFEKFRSLMGKNRKTLTSLLKSLSSRIYKKSSESISYQEG